MPSINTELGFFEFVLISYCFWLFGNTPHHSWPLGDLYTMSRPGTTVSGCHLAKRKLANDPSVGSRFWSLAGASHGHGLFFGLVAIRKPPTPFLVMWKLRGTTQQEEAHRRKRRKHGTTQESAGSRLAQKGQAWHDLCHQPLHQLPASPRTKLHGPVRPLLPEPPQPPPA